jgi:hypothetical protein
VPLPLESQPCRSEDRRYKEKGWPERAKLLFAATLWLQLQRNFLSGTSITVELLLQHRRCVTS